jgi:FkbM family methyltransferase
MRINLHRKFKVKYLSTKHRVKIYFFLRIISLLKIAFPHEVYEYLHGLLRSKFLRKSSGILHVGASFGQEAPTYSMLEKKVIWVEAIPAVFNDLRNNISAYPNQIAVNALLGDAKCDKLFYLTNNNFMSSSTYKLNEMSKFQSDFQVVETISLEAIRLDELFTSNQIFGYSHWVIDVQGAELDVLCGAGERLHHCQSIEIECTNFNVYDDAPRLDEISVYLEARGFIRLLDPPNNFHGDVIFCRIENLPTLNSKFDLGD